MTRPDIDPLDSYSLSHKLLGELFIPNEQFGQNAH